MNIKELRKCSFCELFWKEKTRKRISENVEVDLRKFGCLTAHDLRDKGTCKHSIETDTEVADDTDEDQGDGVILLGESCEDQRASEGDDLCR